MSGSNRRDVELAMRVQDLASADFKKISEAVKELTGSLDGQIIAASKGKITAGELRESLEKLRQAGDGLKQQGALTDRYEGLNTTLRSQEAALHAALVAQNEYVAVLNKAGTETVASANRQETLAKAVNRAQDSIEKTRTALQTVSGALTAAGIDTRNLTSAQENLKSVAGQVGQAQTALNASLVSYSGNVRRAKEEVAALAAAEKARSGGSVPGFIRPAPPSAPTPNAVPGFIRPTIPSEGGAGGKSAEELLFGLRPYELQNLSYQLNDVFTQFLSGTHLTQIAAQQGGQILQVFNKSLFSLLPLLPAIGAALAVAGLAFAEFSRQWDVSASTRQFRADIESTTNGVAYSAEKLTAARKTIQDYGTAWDDAGKLISDAIATGLNPDKILQFAKVAQDITDRTGAKFPQVAADLTRVFTGPFEGIVKLNEQYGFWTAAQVAAGRELAENGDLAKVQTDALNALSTSQAKNKDALMPLTTAWRTAMGAWHSALDTIWEADNAGLQTAIDGWGRLFTAIKNATVGAKEYNEERDKPPARNPDGEAEYRRIQARIAAGGSGFAGDATDAAERHINQTLPEVGSFIPGGQTAQLVNAWCAAFANAALAAAGIQGSGSNVATDFEKWGVAVTDGAVKRNDILVQSKGHPAGEAGGHVGLATGQFKTAPDGTLLVEMISGNYSGKVSSSFEPLGSLDVRRAPGGAAAGDTVGLNTQARIAAGAELLKNQREQIAAANALRDATTDQVRMDLARKQAVADASRSVSDPAVLKAIGDTAAAQVRAQIATERYAYSTKEAAEAVKSAGNLAKDRAAYDAGVAEARANGTQKQSDLDEAGNKAREIARAKRLKDEQAILDIEAQAARSARFKEFAPDVLAAGQAKYNELLAKGVTTVETLRAARNQAEDEAFAKLQRNKQLQNQGDSLQTQLSSLTRGDLKSPLQELQVQLQAVDNAYAGLRRRVEEFRTAGGTTVGKGATAVPVQQFSQEIDAAQKRTVALTTLKNAEDSVNKIIQERGVLVKTVDDLVAQGQLSLGEGEAAKQKVYEETNKALLPAIDTWQAVTDAATAAKDVSGVTLDLITAKIKLLRGETALMNPLVAQLVKGLPEAFGSAVVRGVETVATAIANLANGTGKLSDVFKSFGSAAVGVLADVLKWIGETILKYYVMMAVSYAMKAAGLSTAALGAGGAAAGAAPAAAPVVAAHGGGVIGRLAPTRRAATTMFANAPRYHTGGLPGLGQDEQSAILLKGEEVLSKGDPRNILNAGKNKAAGGDGFAIRNVLVFDPETIPAAMASSEGERVLLQHIKRNAPAIRQMIGR